MAEYIEREAAIAIIEDEQKKLCPHGLWGRRYASDIEKYDALEATIDRMNAIPTAEVEEVRWISVKDRLPDLGVQVLVFADGDIGISELYQFDLEGNQMWDFTGLGRDPEYWSPLPQPPKMEVEE